MEPRRAAIIVALIGATLATPTSTTAQTAACGNGVVEAGEECDDGNAADGDCCSARCTAADSGTPCDDGRGCTLEDACRRGVCVGQPADALCALRLDHLTCYRVGRAAGGGHFAPRPGEPVLDEFRSDHPDDPQTLDLRKPAVVCSAAGVSTPALGVHEEGYLARARPRPKRERRVQELESGLGRMTLKLKRPARLLVPSGLALGTHGATPPPPAARRFTCYQAALVRSKRRRARPPDAFVPTTATLADLRGGPWRYRVGLPTSLCVPELPPVSGDSAPPPAHVGYLVCHRGKVAKRNPPAARAAAGVVSTANRFGAEVLKARRLAEICVPAVLAAPRGATATAARFRFLTEPGEVNGALKTLFEQGAMAPHTSDAARAAQQDIDTAKGVINQHLAEARAELLDALGVLGADDEGGYAALGPIIEVAGDAPEILDHLAGLLMSPPRGQELFPHVIPGDELVRHLALAQLAGYAGKGSEAAKARILEAVGSPDPGIQAMAVLHVYAFSPNRHLAQRAMRSRLGPQSRHLLYEQ